MSTKLQFKENNQVSYFNNDNEFFKYCARRYQEYKEGENQIINSYSNVSKAELNKRLNRYKGSINMHFSLDRGKTWIHIQLLKPNSKILHESASETSRSDDFESKSENFSNLIKIVFWGLIISAGIYYFATSGDNVSIPKESKLTNFSPQTNETHEEKKSNPISTKKSLLWYNNPEDVDRIVDSIVYANQYNLDEETIQTVKDILNDERRDPEGNSFEICGYNIVQCSWCSDNIKVEKTFYTAFDKMLYIFRLDKYARRIVPGYNTSSDDIYEICLNYRNGNRYYCEQTDRNPEYCSKKCESEASNRY
jgi:hypothetical protein